MKKIVKILLSLCGLVYLGIIIFATICLLFYNQYKVTQINDKTFILIDKKSDKYTDGDLVIFTKNPNSEIKTGDEIFFYEVSQGKVSVNTGVVTKSEFISDDETTFTINNNHPISSESVIGKTLTANVYHGVGKVLYVLESRFGFLLLVILPALLFFFYEIYRLIMEIKTPVTEDDEVVNQVPSQETDEKVVSGTDNGVLDGVVDSSNPDEDVKPLNDVSINTNNDSINNTISADNNIDNLNTDLSSLDNNSNNFNFEQSIVNDDTYIKPTIDDSFVSQNTVDNSIFDSNPNTQKIDNSISQNNQDSVISQNLESTSSNTEQADSNSSDDVESLF